MPAAPVPRIGDMRESVRIERRSTGSPETPFGDDAPYGDDTEHAGTPFDDGFGNVETDWEIIIPARPARLAPKRGGEDVQAARLAGREAWEVWLRLDSVSAVAAVGDRVVDARNPARIFNIRFVGNLDERGRYLLLECELGVAT